MSFFHNGFKQYDNAQNYSTIFFEVKLLNKNVS